MEAGEARGGAYNRGYLFICMSFESISTSPQPSRMHAGRGVFRPYDAQPFNPDLFMNSSQRSSRVLARRSEDCESQSLLRRNSHSKSTSLAVPLTLAAVVVLWITVIAVVSVLYYKVTSSMVEAQEIVGPHLSDAFNHTMSILKNVDESTISANGMVDKARSVSDQALPAMERVMNQTQEMISRLETLAKHPVMQISLSNGP